jgi:hypothetical protein
MIWANMSQLAAKKQVTVAGFFQMVQDIPKAYLYLN